MNVQEQFDLAKAALDAEIAESRRVALAEAEAIPVAYDWTVAWKTAHTFYCSRRVSDATLTAIDAWAARYPAVVFPRYRLREAHNEGMTYLLIGNYLAQTGGGTLVLHATAERDTFSPEPLLLSDKQRDALLAGNVPKSLRR